MIVSRRMMVEMMRMIKRTIGIGQGGLPLLSLLLDLHLSFSSASPASPAGLSASATRGKAKENAGQDVRRVRGSRSREEFIRRLKAFISSA